MKNLLPILLIVLLFIAVPVAMVINLFLFPLFHFVSMLICIVLATREIDSNSAFGWGLAGFFLGILGVIIFIFVQYLWPHVDPLKKIIYENIFNGLAISAVGVIILIFGSFLMYNERVNPGSFGTGVYGIIPIPGPAIIMGLMFLGLCLLFFGFYAIFRSKRSI